MEAQLDGLLQIHRPKMVILGSREQLCIHEKVSLLHGKAQSNACVMLRRNRDQKENQGKHEKPRCAHYYRVAGISIELCDCGCDCSVFVMSR